MSKRWMPVAETRTIDDVVCCRCGHRFNPDQYTNYGMSNEPWFFNCPSCEKPIEVWASVEYMCVVPDDESK